MHILVVLALLRDYQRVGWGGGAYIGHPMYENTIMPNIFAKLRDKGVTHQNEVGLH